MTGAVLITGATGLVGGQVAARYLERTDRELILPVRAADDAEARRRVDEALSATYGPQHPYGPRLTAVAADLERPDLGLDAARIGELGESVTTIVHAAASVSFSLPLDAARAINVEGTRRMLELAARCPELEAYTQVSTTYVAGDHHGEFGEDDVDVGQAFRNTYERTKMEAEGLVRAAAGSLPVRIVRPGIIVGEERSGWTSSFNVLYYPIKLFARGAAPPIIPGRPGTPIDAVPVDYVADGIFELTEREAEPGATFHLVSGSEAPTIGAILDASARHFGRRKRPMMPLWLYMRTVHQVVIRAYRGKRRRQLQAAAEFLPYFDMHQTFDDRRAREALDPAGLGAPRFMDYIERLYAYAVASDWGRAPLTRDDARALADADERAQALTAAP
jgi:thioester reductase-like protein